MDDYLVPTASGVKPMGEHIAELIAGIRAKDPRTAAATEAVFDASVAYFRKNLNDEPGAAELQCLPLVRDTYQLVVQEQASGGVIAQLGSYSRSEWGPEVRERATALEAALRDRIAAFAIKATFADGALELPFPIEVGGRVARAGLVGTYRQVSGSMGVIDAARARIAGRDYVLTDDALLEVLKRAGRGFNASDSSQTEVLSRGILHGIFGTVPAVVHYDGERFRMIEKADFEGHWVYYHDKEVAVIG